MSGPQAHQMAMTAAERCDTTEIARDRVVALADATGESALLSLSRGE